MFRRTVIVALLVCVAPIGAQAQDFSVLSALHEADRPVAALERRAPGTPRILIAGDSWAQFMWDDRVHDAILERFGLADVAAISLSLGSDPGPGYTGPEVAISGSEARQWADTASYPWVDNVVSMLETYPTIDRVVLSIGGNDVLAGRSGDGWYKDMDLDVPGSEAAFFDRLENDTLAVIDAILAVRPEIEIVLSSYDYPNFNVGFWCFLYACPKREDLSRDPQNALITDAELNALMIDVETRRRGWAATRDRLWLDNSIGLMHHVYGDGISAARVLPRPGRVAPDYAPFPGGNPLRPTLRSNFRRASGLDADPIHLTAEGYRHKAGQEIWAHLLRALVPEPELRVQSAGGVADGWTNGTTVTTNQLSVGDDGTQRVVSILRFDLTPMPANATVTGARLWLTRTSGVGTNPFSSGALGPPRVELSFDGFGTAGVVEGVDRDAPADLDAVATFVGAVAADGNTLRVDLGPAAAAALTGRDAVELRVSFASADANASRVVFADADVGPWTPSGVSTFAETLGSAAPVLEMQLEAGTSAPSLAATRLVLATPRPNPFNPRTEIVFSLTQPGRVQIDAHDARGRRVRRLTDAIFAAGEHRMLWDGRDDHGVELGSGVYFVRALSGGQVAVQRAVLAR